MPSVRVGRGRNCAPDDAPHRRRCRPAPGRGAKDPGGGRRPDLRRCGPRPGRGTRPDQGTGGATTAWPATTGCSPPAPTSLSLSGSMTPGAANAPPRRASQKLKSADDHRHQDREERGGPRSRSRKKIIEIAKNLGEVAQRLRSAESKAKAALYEALGITVRHENAMRTVTVRSRPSHAYRRSACPRSELPATMRSWSHREISISIQGQPFPRGGDSTDHAAVGEDGVVG